MSHLPLTISLRRLAIGACCLLSALLAGPAPVVAAELNISHNQLPVNLGPYLDYYEDSTATLTIDDILDGEIAWERSGQDIPTLGMSRSAHWFNIVLSGQTIIDEELVLSLQAPILDRVEFYFVVGDEVVKRTVAGDSIPFSELDFPYRFPVIPFQLNTSTDEAHIYFRATSSVGVEIPLQLMTFALLTQNQQGQLAFHGALIMLFAGCFAVCLILYFFMRDRHFLATMMFFGGGIIFLLAQTGMGRMWFWGDTSSANSRLSVIGSCILIASMCQIGRALESNYTLRDSINLVLRFIAWLMLPTALFFLLIPFSMYSAQIIFPLMMLGLFVALAVLIMTGTTALHGSRAAVYLFYSWLSIIISYLTMLLFKFDLMDRGAASSVVSEIFAAIAAVLLLMSVSEFVRNKNRELSEARIETKAKGDFLKNVSREFLTPVHLILANSKRLLAAHHNKLDDNTKQHLNTVIKQSDHLHNLINDLLEMAELESDSFEPQFELVEMSHFLSEVKDLMSAPALEKGLDLYTQFSSTNMLVQTDKSRLQHALINILSNAIKFTETGRILLGYKAVYFRRNLGIEIYIQDTGRGMSEDFQQRLFQEFSRESDYPEREPEGTGLGLVIVKRMIERLGGEISFESRSAEGSQFFIRLPLRTPRT